MGRSAAIALAILVDRMGPGCERAALDELLAIRPTATPNLVVVKIADEILERQGGLVTAVAEWEAVTPGLAEKRKARRQLVESNPELYSWL